MSVFDWIKNKAFNLRWLDDSLDFLSNQVNSEEVNKQADRVAGYIWIGLFRIESEGLSPKFFTELYRKAKDEAVSKYQLQSVEHVDFAAPYIAMQFFLGIQLSKDVPDAKKVLARILAYIKSNCKNEKTASYVLAKFGISFPTRTVPNSDSSREGDSFKVLSPSDNARDVTASRLMSNWLLHMKEYESLGARDQEIVKREIYSVYQQTLSDYPSILSIERSSLIPVLDAYHVQFREIAKANILRGLAGRILIIAYKSTIFCSNDVAEDFKEFAFSLVLEGKDLEENSAVNLSSTNSYNIANKTSESVVVSSHPILNEYIDLCRKFNSLSLTPKYEARLALHEIYEAVFELHGYVTCTRVFNEKQFLAIRKAINENSTGSELKRVMGEFMWSTLQCLRFGDAALRSLADENFGETCLSEDDCSYEAFIADLEIQNIRVPDASYTILTEMSTDDPSDAIVCPSCKKCVLILKGKNADRCRFCNSNIREAKSSAAEKKSVGSTGQSNTRSGIED